MDLRRVSPLLISHAKSCVLALCLSATCVAAASAQPRGNTQALDEIVVVVNGQAISALELQRRERFLLEQLKRSKQTIPNQQELSTAILERAIFESLMLQSAAKQGLVPTDAMVQQAIAENAFQSGLDVPQFIARVEQSGSSLTEYTNDLKNEMAMGSVRERAMGSKVKVTDAEVDRFLREDQTGVGQEYAAQVLFLAKSESASPQQTSQLRAQAQALQQSARAAQSEAAYAALQPSLANQKHEVNLGFRALDKLPELYSAALENMAVGATSPMLESSAGFYILRLTNKRTVLPQVTQTKARHILIRVDGGNADAEEVARQTIKTLHDRLTLNIDLFPALAKEFGQDGSASKGGDLGWAFPGDMVPEFERVMTVLKEGEMGLPLRSQFGWHILQVLERKAGDLPKERLRAQARTVIRARKQDEALGEWLDQLKAQAYIEYKR
jgi:peptidyl-prolyl cis-trans isomerase SurA